jgi:hypothetical protein
MTRAKNPYVGPRSFRRDPEEAKLFFGREQEAQDLLVRVLSERLTLFYAQSGAGKSSLINARLIPNLEERGIVVLPVGRISGNLPPGLGDVDNIFLFNLMDHIDDVENLPQRYAHISLSHFLQRLVSEDGRHFRYEPDLAVAAADPAQIGVPYVLIIDQFEEIITAHPERWQEREGFFRGLNEAMQADPNLSVVLSLREDFVPAIEPYAPLLADRMRARFYMQRMQERQALDAVRNPVQVRQKQFDPNAAQALVDNLRQIQTGKETALGQYVEPVQLQVVCFQLWESLGQAQKLEITLADLERLAGGRSLAEFVNQALRDFYERVLREVLADPAVKSSGDLSVLPHFV